MQRRHVVVSLVALLGLALGAGTFALAAPKAKDKAAKKAGAPVVVEVKTSMGAFKIELYADKAPKTVENFLKYVDDKFYDGTIFHRVISDFMIQGGGFDKALSKKDTREPVTNEAKDSISNAKYTVAMARTSDPNSATAQFFVNVKDNKRLDYSGPGGGEGYCAFGKVISGMDVIDKIKDVPTGMQGGMSDVPQTPVVIESIRRVK
jgi:cyclophilin family peptidyl-prolyl cis-trans isomerase